MTSSKDANPAPVEAQNITAVEGQAFRVSDCCLAAVTEHVTTHRSDESGSWQGVHFTCSSCGQECAIHTNPTIVALMAENRDLKGRLGDA